MPPTGHPTGASQGDTASAQQDRRLFYILMLIIAGGTAVMGVLVYGTS